MGDADALLQIEQFGVREAPVDLGGVAKRADDYYLSLVGELFDRMRSMDAGADNDGPSWARLGNALAQFGADERLAWMDIAVSRREALLFAAAAFYCGGFPASALLTVRRMTASEDESEASRACFDLLAKPARLTSSIGRTLLDALRRGDMAGLTSARAAVANSAELALLAGPGEWIFARLLSTLVARFGTTNVRAVLPDGGSEFWTALVESFLARRPASWEFFPSQIEALKRGLLERTDTFSLQMPTGAGKTALSETLLYHHCKSDQSVAAVLLVPYRSLASELRRTLVRRLSAMGIAARSAYGGTVPSGDEVRELADAQVVVATPEALAGLLAADPAFSQRVSLVICDEGHLLDSEGRGVSLELLLARFRGREGGAPRFVFVSAIVPNVEEINAWLGGEPDAVIRSHHRPALAEFAVLRTDGTGARTRVDLEMHPHESPPARFAIEGFLEQTDFRWRNPVTGRLNTFPFASFKTQAVAAARKALRMGGVAVFAANKRGKQGAIGLAEELIEQLESQLPLPHPKEFANATRVGSAARYLALEFGGDWVGTRVLEAGAVLHHGDLPQETREVLERLLVNGDLRLAFCTSTLAEGVNLPIRTLVLYSLERRHAGGAATTLLVRDVKNLVGRAGRAGATTKGLVICVNPRQWPLVEQVARQEAMEPVQGALRALIERVRTALALQSLTLTNEMLEETAALHSLVDGVDATLMELASEELGEEAFAQLAREIATHTFAWQQVDEDAKALLRDVFELRARRIAAIQARGRLGWLRETGASARMLQSVEQDLFPRRDAWDDVADPIDPAIVDALLEWAWTQPNFRLS